MHTDRLRQLATEKGPFISVYLDDSHNTEEAGRGLELRWRALREQLESANAPTVALDEVETAVLDGAPPVGESGRAVVADSEQILLDEHLIRPPVSPVARWSSLPYVIPLVEHGRESVRHIVAIVDHRGADLRIINGDSVTHSETIEGEGYPVHKASGAETPGYGDPQPHTEEQARKNIREVARRLVELVDAEHPEVVFVVGEHQSVGDLSAELPKRVTEIAVDLGIGARGASIDEAVIRAAIAEEMLRRRNSALAEAAERFRAEQGRDSGLGVEGLTSVCGALRNGEVDTLLVGDLGDATVVVGDDLMAMAPTPENLSELGASPADVLRADEALPLIALRTDSDLVRLDERLAPKDGVAALLRYAPRRGSGA
ncbi:hypothetical protein V1Y59_21555 [Gordonia sp. PKS22-38]|uniref:Peptide chain release factor 1 (ERF1) n=1 Tax=Gordonia prachuapensis TaxID=3115651 RepID=A0ABU7MZB7_9ACTN|nr:hypothetical protein [Gordonia sp. PKS22-38]